MGIIKDLMIALEVLHKMANNGPEGLFFVVAVVFHLLLFLYTTNKIVAVSAGMTTLLFVALKKYLWRSDQVIAPQKGAHTNTQEPVAVPQKEPSEVESAEDSSSYRVQKGSMINGPVNIAGNNIGYQKERGEHSGSRRRIAQTQGNMFNNRTTIEGHNFSSPPESGYQPPPVPSTTPEVAAESDQNRQSLTESDISLGRGSMFNGEVTIRGNNFG